MALFERSLKVFGPEGDTQFTQLHAEKILFTIGVLQNRIGERFPDSGLLKVCREFNLLAKSLDQKTKKLRDPIWPVRIASFIAVAAILFMMGYSIYSIWNIWSHWNLPDYRPTELVSATESLINELILVSLALFFLVNLENRLKRKSALKSIHMLRSLAHVIDMHQLTKDPVMVFNRPPHADTSSSPVREMNRYELTRYLDYCSELLALISKIGALFAQNTEDEVILESVSDLSEMTQGLSAKIWQKIMIIDLSEE